MAKPKNSFMLVMDVIDYEAMMKRVDELGVTRAAFIRAAIASALDGGTIQSVEKRSRQAIYDDDHDWGASMPYSGPDA